MAARRYGNKQTISHNTGGDRAARLVRSFKLAVWINLIPFSRFATSEQFFAGLSISLEPLQITPLLVNNVALLLSC